MTTLTSYNSREADQVPRETLVVTASTTWNPGDLDMVVDSTDGVITLTAPEPSLCVGKGHYNIVFQVDGGNTTVAFPNGPIDPGDQVMTAVGDFVTCHATTDAWIVDTFQTTT